jgi:putative intracellular protease/amidase/mannose/cellobiose epimerase-like protein (N-acyl-D-glucosamine 2-epimerase family)
MTEIALRDGGRLAGKTVAILLEGDYVEPELDYYVRRFPEEGARVLLLTRLWGQQNLTFRGHEHGIPITVTGDLEEFSGDRISELDALIVPSGMVSDRLRYAEDVRDLAPAVRLLRHAFGTPGLLKGIICHGMWLASPIPEVVRGRRVTCHNNLIGDVRNMGASYTDQDVVVDGDLVTGRSAAQCHLFARMIIDLLAARGERVSARPAITPRPALASIEVPTAAPGSAAERRAVPLVSAAQGNAIQGAGDVNRLDFTFSDVVAGYVTGYDAGRRLIDLRTSDERAYQVRLTESTSAQFLRNLGDPYLDAAQRLAELLVPGRHLFARGIYYPEDSGTAFEAASLVITGQGARDYAFEQPDWWTRQLRELGSFYRRAQFGTARHPDYSTYRTMVRLGGEKTSSFRQETDTISRMVYGMASAYLLTGDEDLLEVAEQGAAYLRGHMRFIDRDEGVTYWYHGIDVVDGTERKVFASEFGDDYDAIPMYEQIYALAGLTQLYRVTGDERLAADIDGTLRLFRKFFHDPEHGGYFSHIDPLYLSPHAESLGPNRARKNWNSVGDHAPAYLINLYLATGDPRHAAMLEDTYDHIVAHMPEEGSPFVQERFHADWSPDRTWGWQQDRSVVGHNLKIAWNLMRLMTIMPKPAYAELSERIARSMPSLGSDQQRGGWYDVMERTRSAGQRQHRLTWHDRKAWWQQEQAILAYQILAGHTGDAEFLRHGREAAAFYNAFFLDHEEGGVYFSVLADGIPFLLGTERNKGSHSMSMYHSAELCYLSTVYQRLLLCREPVTLWFRPRPNAFPDGVLRVAPDALPAGRVRLEWAEIDGVPYAAIDSAAMTIKLPEADSPVTVRAHLVPASD